MKKTIAIICLLLAVGSLAYWYASGHHIFTQTKVDTVVQQKDPVFDTVTETHVWKDELRLGLDWLGSISGGLTLVAGIFFILHRRDRKRAAVAQQTPSS